MDRPYYMNWIIKEEGTTFKDGIEIDTFKIDYDINDDTTLDNWALHIRRHYIEDNELEDDCEELELSAEEYLKQHVIPQRDEKQGPMARSADITEILVADLLEFIFNYNVPRIKQRNRSNKNLVEHGTDVIGYKFKDKDKKPDTSDVLISAEVKALLSQGSYEVITNAHKDSLKDKHRLSLTLNYYRKKLKNLNNYEEANDIARFQKYSEKPYKTIYSGFGVSSVDEITNNIITTINGEDLEIQIDQQIYYIHGKRLMELAHNVYDRCIKL